MTRLAARAALLAAAGLSSIALARPALARTAETAAFGVQAQQLADAAGAQGGRACEAPMIGQVAATTDAAGFDQLDVAPREVLLQIRMNCAARAGDRPTATAAARRLTASEFQPEVRGRAALQVALDDLARSDTRSLAQNIRIVLETTPDRAVALPLQLYALVLSDRDLDPAFITALRRAPWTTEEAHSKVDNDWALREAVQAADAGDMTRASAALSRASEPSVLMAVYQDRRFERLWPQMQAEGRFDWRAKETARLAGIDERIAREPRRLELVVQRIQALRYLERYDEARAVGADYARRLKKDNAFDDQNDQKAWVLYAYASVLDDLGETAPADAALVTAADGSDKISQHVNRAALLVQQGRAAEALETLDKIPPGYGTPYGRMVTASNRLCALALLDRRQEAEAELAKLTSNWRDEPGSAVHGLACLQRDDEAAALLIHWLEDPGLRGDALAWFRNGRQPPGAKAAADKTPPILRRASQLGARSDVQAALAKVGRPLDYDLASQYGS